MPPFALASTVRRPPGPQYPIKTIVLVVPESVDEDGSVTSWQRREFSVGDIVRYVPATTSPPDGFEYNLGHLYGIRVTSNDTLLLVRFITSYARLMADNSNQPPPDLPPETNNPHEVFYTPTQYTISARQVVGKDVLWEKRLFDHYFTSKPGKPALRPDGDLYYVRYQVRPNTNTGVRRFRAMPGAETRYVNALAPTVSSIIERYQTVVRMHTLRR